MPGVVKAAVAFEQSRLKVPENSQGSPLAVAALARAGDNDSQTPIGVRMGDQIGGSG